MPRYLSIVFLVSCLIAPPAFAEALHFQSPSGNIRCVIADGDGAFVRCDLGVDEQTYTARPAACDGQWGTSFGLTMTGDGFLNCVTVPIDPDATPIVLPYGTGLEAAGITCQSEVTGITCTNNEGGGFAVRRAEQRVF
ncbi:hypothetical protein SAMN05444714_0423 [Yoonia litorea]|uniref:CVNH domain-containing protein n=1 Tax=Yoonia litorea TaxID=1123755 RepID=A0A1I6LDI4_9RHOB|nr:hypothetical protein SAMN05444714_0423 [Yoonia litorea]